MGAIYVVGVFLGLLLGVPIGFWWGARTLEKRIQREQDEANAEIMKRMDWQE